MKTLKEIIVERIESVQGCKGVELGSWLGSTEPGKYDLSELPMVLEELVNEGHIIEVAYSLPNMGYREKSFYLPAGSTVRLCPEWLFSQV